MRKHGMFMRWSFFLVLPILAACGASIDPAVRASIDAQAAAIAPSDAVYPAPTRSEPMPLAPGQWTRLKLVTKDGQPSFSTYKVLAQEGDAYWFEIVTDQYSGRSIVKMLVSFGDRTDPDQFDMRRLIVKMKDREPIDYQEPLLGIVRGAYKSILKGLAIRWEGLPQETKKVPAGTFTDAFKAHTEVNLYGYTTRATSWSHSDVPIQGLVHSDGDEGSKIDLVAFGLRGATSDM